VRAEAVRLCIEEKMTLMQVGAKLDIPWQTVNNWVSIARAGAQGKLPQKRRAKYSSETKSRVLGLYFEECMSSYAISELTGIRVSTISTGLSSSEKEEEMLNPRLARFSRKTKRASLLG
jgi:transposase-like protein